MEDYFLSVTYNSALDQETEFISCHVDFNLIDIITDETTRIGSASLYILNTFLKESWQDIFEAADSISGDLHHIVHNLSETLENESDFLGLLAILDRIQINEAYRGKGYGTKALTEIMKYLQVLRIDYLALIPTPFEEKDEKKKQMGTERLVKFYEKFHLKVVKKIAESELIMGRNLN